jgi:hypothetical protein
MRLSELSGVMGMSPACVADMISLPSRFQLGMPSHRSFASIVPHRLVDGHGVSPS